MRIILDQRSNSSNSSNTLFRVWQLYLTVVTNYSCRSSVLHFSINFSFFFLSTPTWVNKKETANYQNHPCFRFFYQYILLLNWVDKEDTVNWKLPNPLDLASLKLLLCNYTLFCYSLCFPKLFTISNTLKIKITKVLLNVLAVTTFSFANNILWALFLYLFSTNRDTSCALGRKLLSRPSQMFNILARDGMSLAHLL